MSVHEVIKVIAPILLFVPALYGGVMLLLSRWYEWQAGKISDPNRRELKAAEARNLASTARLLPTPFLIFLVLGLGLQVYVHIDGLLGLHK